MSGTLYLCATPIGNMNDMTFRAVETLKNADLIAAEDTRNSRKILDHFDIKTPMTSYHEHNKWEKGKELIEKLRAGMNIALITDAGMPGISDPGEELCRMAHEEGIRVSVIPGASASVSALAASGLPSGHFVFEGFLPRVTKERRERFEALSREERTMIIYEAPHRITKTMEELKELFGADRKMTICRELTKKHEEIKQTTFGEAAAYYEANEPKGEFVLVIEGISKEQIKENEKEKWDGLSLEEHMQVYINQGMDKKEAMKKVAADRGVSKRDIYNELNAGK